MDITPVISGINKSLERDDFCYEFINRFKEHYRVMPRTNELSEAMWAHNGYKGNGKLKSGVHHMLRRLERDGRIKLVFDDGRLRGIVLEESTG